MKKVKWGVIGAGGIADRRTIPGLLRARNCELIALMDPVNIETIARKYNIENFSDKAEDIFGNPDVDAIYIASPVYYHKEQVIESAKAKKHILCEKPLALTSEDAEEMVLECEKNDVLLQEGYMIRFHGAHQEMKRMIDKGMIGKPVYTRAQLSCWYPPIEGAWRQIPEKGGGGALIDMASHLYDLLEMFLGPVSQIASFTNTQVFDYPVEDSSTTLMKFKSGEHATVDCFFCIPDEASKTRLEIYGSEGCLLSEGTIGQGDGGCLEIFCKSEDTEYDAVQKKDVESQFKPVDFKKVNMYTAECEYLSDCILNNKRVEINSGRNGIHILKMIEAAYKSSNSGIYQSVE